MASYVEHPPVPALADLVRVVWIQRTGAAPYVQRNLPTGGMELHCHLGRLPRLVGPPEAALSVLTRWLIHSRAADPDPLVSEAVRLLMPWRAGDVGAVSRRLAISASQLRRRCLNAVGTGPKALQRTLRFQGFLALAQAGGTPDLAALAADLGYADHAHLTRECLRLTGVAPRAFLDDVAGRCACGHDHAASYLPMLRERPELSDPRAMLTR